MKVEQVEVKVEQVEMKVKQGLVSAVACVRLVLPPSGSCWRGLLPSAVVFRSLCRAHCPHCHLVWQILPTLLHPPPHPSPPYLLRPGFCTLHDSRAAPWHALDFDIHFKEDIVRGTRAAVVNCVPCFIVPSVALLAPQPPPAPWKQCRAILRNLGGGWFVGEGGGARARGRGRGRFWGVFVWGFPPTPPPHTPPHPNPRARLAAPTLPRPPQPMPVVPVAGVRFEGKAGSRGSPTGVFLSISLPPLAASVFCFPHD